MTFVVVQHWEQISEEAVSINKRPAAGEVNAAPALVAQRSRAPVVFVAQRMRSAAAPRGPAACEAGTLVFVAQQWRAAAAARSGAREQ